MTTLIQFTQQYGSYNGADIAGFPDATASELVAQGVAQLYNDGAVEAQSYQRALGAGELPSSYEALGFTLGDQVPSAAVQGVLGETTISFGRAVPNSLVGDPLQG